MANISSSSSSSSGGIGFLGALTILFIALKLLGYIDWSWWWVLSPLWGGVAFALTAMTAVVGRIIFVEWRKDRRAERLARERRERIR